MNGRLIDLRIPIDELPRVLMKKIVPLVLAHSLLVGCATTVTNHWSNSLYKNDRENSMEKYYGRDFVICLNIAIDALQASVSGKDTLEQQTNDCLRRAGWVESSLEAN